MQIPYTPAKISGSTKSNFQLFLDNFPTPEARLAGAERLLDPAFKTNDDTFITRYLLAAHWGDDEDRLSETAEWLYALKKTVDQSVGQTVLTYVQNAPDGHTEADKPLKYPIVLEAGILSEGVIKYRFSGRRTHKGPSQYGIKPPYIWFEAALPVVDARGLTIDAHGVADVTDTDIGDGLLTVYSGVISLDPDMSRYPVNRFVMGGEVYLGNEEACTELYRLAGRVAGKDVYHPRLLKLVQADEVHPERPLPDLGLIFGQAASGIKQ